MFKFKNNGFYFVRENPSVQINTDVSNVKSEDIALPSLEPVFGSDDEKDKDKEYQVFKDTDLLYKAEFDPIKDMEIKELDDAVATGSRVAADNINPQNAV